MSVTDSLTALPAWQALLLDARDVGRRHLREVFAADPDRVARYTRQLGDLRFDFSKQRIDDAVLTHLVALAHARGLEEGIAQLARGELMNFTEGRAAQHMALRSDRPALVCGEDVLPRVEAARSRVREIAEAFRAGALRGGRGATIRHVVNIGIGGSDLGPRMCVNALRAPGDARVSFVANLDPSELAGVLTDAAPDETLFIVSSKSFTTQETLANAETARAWLRAALGADADLAPHFYAVSNNVDAARAFGIPAERCLALPEWVGGRYSMWSVIGLAVACAIGAARFDELLAGAREVDDHFTSAPLADNLPVLMGLLAVWNTNFLGAHSHAVLPYSQRLADLPAYLQQLDMESNGKRVDRHGELLDIDTAPILWGGAGTVGQHAYHQLLYQGTRVVPLDFIVPVGADTPAQRMLVDNALAQGAALMLGRDEAQAREQLAAQGLAAEDIERLAPHLVCPGNQPSSTLLFPRLDARALGRLVALYEHRTFVQGWLWGINSFDQYGVELGKQMARALAGQGKASTDASTQVLAAAAAEMRKPH